MKTLVPLRNFACLRNAPTLNEIFALKVVHRGKDAVGWVPTFKPTYIRRTPGETTWKYGVPKSYTRAETTVYLRSYADCHGWVVYANVHDLERKLVAPEGWRWEVNGRLWILDPEGWGYAPCALDLAWGCPQSWLAGMKVQYGSYIVERIVKDSPIVIPDIWRLPKAE